MWKSLGRWFQKESKAGGLLSFLISLEFIFLICAGIVLMVSIVAMWFISFYEAEIGIGLLLLALSFAPCYVILYATTRSKRYWAYIQGRSGLVS